MILTVFVYNVIYYPLSALHAKVHIKVRHGYSFGVKEPFKQKIISQRINTCDTYTISAQAACSRASSAAYGYTVGLGIVYKIPDYEVIVGVAHFGDYVKFILQPLTSLRCGVLVTLFKPLAAHFTQKLLVIFHTVDMEIRKLGISKLKFHVAHLCDLNGIFYRLRIIGKKPGHFISAFNVKLLGGELKLIGIVKGCAGGDTKQHPLCFCVFSFKIVTVVGGCKGDPCFPGNPCKKGNDPFLVIYIMILKFKVIVALSEYLVISQSSLLCSLIISAEQLSWYFSCKAGRKADKSPAILFKQLFIDPWLIVKALGIRKGNKLYKVAVALLVFAQKHQMIGRGIHPVHLIKACTGRNIHFAAYYRFYSLCLAGVVKFHRCKHIAVVCDRTAGLSQLFNCVNELSQTAGTVK